MKVRKWVAIWLIVGLVMVYFQIIIGGITRLTGSGLSITEWDIVWGTFPPVSEGAWAEEFELYKQTPQYAKINEGMEMGSIFEAGTFKFIYFWEYFHRLWARSMGFVFLFPFSFFYLKKWLPKTLLKDLGIVVGLAALAAMFGWVMVASGLVNRPWVNAYKLSIHLSIGISVFCYLFWSFLKYVGNNWNISASTKNSSRFVAVIFVVIVLQIFLGGIMSGMKAALIYPSWPLIGDQFIPSEVFDGGKWSLNSFIHYDDGSFVFSVMHTLHRMVAYTLGIIIVLYAMRNKIFSSRSAFTTTYKVFMVVVFVQIVVGIVTVVKSIGVIPVFWGVLHQAIAVFVIGTFLLHWFVVRKGRESVAMT